MSARFQGQGVSPGTAVGPVYLVRDTHTTATAFRGLEDELRALDAAVAESAAQLGALAARLRSDGHGDEAGIMEAQAVMAADPSFLGSARDGIGRGISASQAVQEAAAQFRAMFEGMDDPYLAARAADVQDVADRLSRNIEGVESVGLDHPAVVVAADLTPSQTASLERGLILGLATDRGSTTSHTAILARALGIPAVVGLGDLSSQVENGVEIGLDGESGIVLVQPSETERTALLDTAGRVDDERARLRSLRNLSGETADGRRLTLAANIGSPADVASAEEAGAEGVGLFRTEFLFAGRSAPPTEDEQVDAYASVLRSMAPHTVVIRTLDVGGDKPLPYLSQSEEMNPFLGQRGVRYTLSHPEVFRTQLRALLRASTTGKLAIMVPMVTTVTEVEVVKAVLAELGAEVGGEAQFGIMVEVPAAALLAREMARHVSFLSVGTNDLVQYALAVDRTNERAASLYQPFHPAVLRLLELTVEGAHAEGKWAGVCGEMAGDVAATPLLVGLGFDELSMTPARIPAVKDRIRRLNASACQRLATRALACETAEEVQLLLRDFAPP